MAITLVCFPGIGRSYIKTASPLSIVDVDKDQSMLFYNTRSTVKSCDFFLLDLLEMINSFEDLPTDIIIVVPDRSEIETYIDWIMTSDRPRITRPALTMIVNAIYDYIARQDRHHIITMKPGQHLSDIFNFNIQSGELSAAMTFLERATIIAERLAENIEKVISQNERLYHTLETLTNNSPTEN